ncbi:TBC1 domain family member 16 [Hetaerina americana]|uniref:TBC1 domain family member 16 n=1 Tax=Hetaerina americana TaxID=62018 RepID=UPI003A7F1C42
MPLPNILRRASCLILGGQCEYSTPSYHDGEVVFCKNNVCVHPPTALRRQDWDVVHHPGYLTVTYHICPQHSGDGVDSTGDKGRPTLRLNWIPNATLRRNPSAAIRQAPNLGSEEQNGSASNMCRLSSSAPASASVIPLDPTSSSVEGTDTESEGGPSSRGDSSEVIQIQNSETRRLSVSMGTVEDLSSTPSPSAPLSRSDSLSSASSTIRVVSSSYLGGGGYLDYGIGSAREREEDSLADSIPLWMLSTPETLALRHNLNFPEGSNTASPIINRARHHHRSCRKFSVDLGEMRSLRLFFSDPEECTSGQLVVASRESQYKILHFHRGGLDRLADVLHQWGTLLQPQHASGERGGKIQSLPYRQFMVCRPEVKEEELHPEEGLIPVVDQEFWSSLLNEEGQIEDDLTLRKGIFFGGLDPKLRKTVWPFLLQCFSFQSTYSEREKLIADRRKEYLEIIRKRECMSPEEQVIFWRSVQCVVEEDVVRTDRSNPYYAGEDNPHVQEMKNILLNYAAHQPKVGYTQGMSDLLAPLLAEIEDASEAFWCFSALMQRHSFVCTPTDNDMDRNLCYLRELIRIMVPQFYEHIQQHTDAMELLFCHRWILLCFKREFTENVALQMWEACWANWATDHFNLFLCLSIICIFAEDVIDQDLRADEMLLHFSSLSMYMDGHLVLRKARGLLYQFRRLPVLPCTLARLCQQCGPGMWDSAHAPIVECICSYQGLSEGCCPHRTNTVP